jgi:FkbM family methyltransferase
MDAAAAQLFEEISVVRDGVEVFFSVVNPRTAWRVQSVMTKEPGTIRWIEEFSPAEVFVDVGANVGLYALCAARFRGVRTYAFEPESQNYAILNQNIHRNGASDLVTAYCIALSDRTAFDVLYLSEFVTGGSCHSFGENRGPDGAPMAPAFRQGCFATTLDTLVDDGVIAPPQHIKIDVDGIEPRVIAGAKRTLAAPGMKSVLVEINSQLDEHWEIIDLLLGLGYNYSIAEADAARRTEGPFEGVGNYVFRR